MQKNQPANPLPKNPNSNFFSPCKKCQSPIFWFSVGSTIPRCIDCELPAAPFNSSRKFVRWRKTRKASINRDSFTTYQVLESTRQPKTKSPPWTQIPAASSVTKATKSATCANRQPATRSNSGLLAFLDADGATHIRVSRFANDPALQRQAETREQYEQRLQDNEQLAKCGDVLKSFYEKANAKK
jgi:hypothetical protein